MKKNFLVAFISILIISTMAYATSYVIHDYDTGIMHMAQDIYLTNTNSVQTQIDSIETNLNGSYALKSGTLSQFTGGTNLNQIATRNHSDLQNINSSESYQHLTTAEVADITLKSGSITQITTRNHNDLQNLNATSAHPSASIDNTSTSYGRGLATTDNTVQKIADRVNQNGTPQFITDKTKCSLLLDFKGTLADRSRAINPIGSDAANKWTDGYVNDSTTKTSATNISCSLKQFEGDEGKFGSGIAVEESRTNLFSNSENLMVAYADGCTITLDRIENGLKIWKVVSTIERGYIYFDLSSNITYSAGQYTLSASINLPSGYEFRINHALSGADLTVTNSNLPKLTRVSKTFNAESYTKTAFRFIWAGAIHIGDTFYITSPQLEAGAFPTSHIATGATAVTRPAGKLNFDPKLINNNQGSISFWYKANYNYDIGGKAKVLLTYTTAGSGNEYTLQYLANEGKFAFYYIKNGVYQYIYSPTQTSEFNGKTFHIVLKWDISKYELYIDKTKVGELTNQNLSELSALLLGCYHIDGYSANGTISNFTIFNYALTADEISQIYNSGLDGKPIAITNPETIIPVGQSLRDTNFVTFTSGWGISTTYPNKPTLSKSSNVALMRGILEYSGTVNSDVTLFTLPVGSRPSLPDTSYHSFVATARDSGAPSMRILRLYGNGNVVLMGQGATIVNPAISLDNINYVNGK